MFKVSTWRVLVDVYVQKWQIEGVKSVHIITKSTLCADSSLGVNYARRGAARGGVDETFSRLNVSSSTLAGLSRQCHDLCSEDDSPTLHWRAGGKVHPVEQNTNNARGEITPQWRLSLKKTYKKDLGQTGNRAVWREFRLRENLQGGGREKMAWVSYEQVYTATRTRRCVRSRNAPGANSRGGGVGGKGLCR